MTRISSIDLDGRDRDRRHGAVTGRAQRGAEPGPLTAPREPPGNNRSPIDFASIKDSVSLAMVLSRYGYLSSLRKHGSQQATVCPIHDGSDPRQFIVHLASNRWFCFSPQCNRGGGIIDLVMLRERVDARRAATLIAEWFALGPPRPLPPVLASKGETR